MMRKSAWQKEFDALLRQRDRYRVRHDAKRELAPELAAKVPDKLRAALNSAFTGAFRLIFRRGTAMINRTFDRQKAEAQYRIDSLAADLHRDRRSLRNFTRRANATSAVGLAVSGVSGGVLGLLGCGLPDIPLLTGMILRSLYAISTNYGYGYTEPEERLYQLLLIEGAMSYGDELDAVLARLDGYVEGRVIPTDEELDEQITRTAAVLADEMLFLKFVQGIPIVGLIGGLSDSVFMHRIQSFAKLNYRYRMLCDRREK